MKNKMIVSMTSKKKKFPTHPKHPERNCWGCDQYCSADSLRCGNGSERTQHPVELWGEDWLEWGAFPESEEKKPDPPVNSE